MFEGIRSRVSKNTVGHTEADQGLTLPSYEDSLVAAGGLSTNVFTSNHKFQGYKRWVRRSSAAQRIFFWHTARFLCISSSFWTRFPTWKIGISPPAQKIFRRLRRQKKFQNPGPHPPTPPYLYPITLDASSQPIKNFITLWFLRV